MTRNPSTGFFYFDAHTKKIIIASRNISESIPYSSLSLMKPIAISAIGAIVDTAISIKIREISQIVAAEEPCHSIISGNAGVITNS
jgi:hypothetical protein